MIRLPNGGDLFDFQSKASEWLLNHSGPNSGSKTLIVKSPTGSGKTIILLDYIDKYFKYINQKTSFIWLSIGSGDLEEQSKSKMDKMLPDHKSKTLKDALNQGFEGKDVTFINWEAVNRQGNKSTRIGEKRNIIDRISEAHRAGIEFIIIVDEEHRSNTNISSDFIINFSALNEIRVSATPIRNDSALTYEIPENEVIASGLITRSMIINEEVDDKEGTNINNEYAYLLELAINKQREIQTEYRRLGKNIRPLVIIQFPDSSDRFIKEVEEYLATNDYTYENRFVAKWLSEDKKNIEGIEDKNATPIFLLWKQALSTGWDCPRAKILVKLRDNMSDTFEIQTIGRIRRMPEVKHYGNTLLDNCYLYTFDEEWKEKALNFPSAYEVKRLFIKDEAKEIGLTREVRDSSSDNFGEREIREILSEYLSNKYKLIKGANLSAKVKEENKDKMKADSWKFGTQISRAFLKGEFVQISDVLRADESQHGITTREVNTHDNGRDVMHIINELHGIISITDGVIRSIVKTLFHEQDYRKGDNLLSLENREWCAFIINNRDKLKDLFREVKSRSLSEEENSEIDGEQMLLFYNEWGEFFKEREFKIPLSEVYRFDSSRKDLESQFFTKNVYDEYQKNMVTDKTRSRIEQKFESYCEGSQKVKFIYKNGDKGDGYFSIAYRDGIGQVRLFYPDYILQLINGEIWIIETKGGERSNQSQNIDMLSELKFDAFKKYVELRHPDIKWGFVRDIGVNLFLNNTKWEEQIALGQHWKRIEEFF